MSLLKLDATHETATRGKHMPESRRRGSAGETEPPGRRGGGRNRTPPPTVAVSAVGRDAFSVCHRNRETSSGRASRVKLNITRGTNVMKVIRLCCLHDTGAAFIKWVTTRPPPSPPPELIQDAEE